MSDPATERSTVASLEARLRVNNARMVTAFENAPTGMAILDHTGRCVRVNAALCRILDREEHELHGRRFAKVVRPDDRVEDERLLRRLLAGELATVQRERHYLRPDGRTVPVLVNVTPLRDEAGAVECFVQVLDLSERERALSELHDRLAQQHAVARLGERAVEGVSAARLIEESVELVASTLGADLACYLEPIEGADELLLRAGSGWPDTWIGNKRLNPGRDVRGGLARCAGPVVSDDVRTETRFRTPTLVTLGIVSGINVVVGDRRSPLGILAVHTREHRTFSEDDITFLQAVAHVLSEALERERAHERARHDALHDSLTALPNRALLLDRLDRALAARSPGGRVGVFCLDVDDFKAVNDALGHDAGDAVLRQLAARLSATIRAGDTVARVGGDEFAVLCPGLRDEEEAELVGDRLAAGVGRPIELGAAPHELTAGIGIAMADADVCPEALIRDADAALYRAKERGRGQRELFDAAMRDRAMARRRLRRSLQRALECDQLQLHYQPVIALDAQEPVGVEALVRWQHPERGNVAPLEFIPVAEQCGLIVKLGAWVLQAACRQLAAWHRASPGLESLKLNVNVSGRQLVSGELPRLVRSVLDETGLPASRLGLEITESVLMESTEEPEARLRELKDLGVGLVLDDFGTGYSSLSHVKRFPIDTLKIDRTFVEGLGDDAGDGAIAAAIVAMAEALEVDIVAEGIESAHQRDRLLELGCRLGQGYLFSGPLPPDELLPRLAPA